MQNERTERLMEIDDLPVRYQEQARRKYKAIEREKSVNRQIPHETGKSRCMELKTAKYGNRRVEVDGIIYDSQSEADRHQELMQLEKLGIISDLQRQVPYELIPKQKDEKGQTVRAVKYIADFVYTEDGKTIVEDKKGFRTKEYKLKKKLMLYRYGITIRET